MAYFICFAAVVTTGNGTEGEDIFSIQHHFTCTSSHLIYCISCSRCGMLYIGETGRPLRTRFGEHRRAVCANDSSQPVARHFNSGSHVITDIKIRALCPISGSNVSRKRHEVRLISILGTLHLKLLMNVFLTFSITCTCDLHFLFISYYHQINLIGLYLLRVVLIYSLV